MGAHTKLFRRAAAGRRRDSKRVYQKQSTDEIRRIRDRLLYGSLGPASPVRRIDPKTGSVVEVIEPIEKTEGTGSNSDT